MAPSDSQNNKRFFERFKVLGSRRIWNLSEGGAYIVTEQPRRLGTVLRFEFKLENGEAPFSALAKVVRVTTRPASGTGEPKGMAVAFIDMSGEDRARLKKYLGVCRQRQKIAQPEEVGP